MAGVVVVEEVVVVVVESPLVGSVVVPLSWSTEDNEEDAMIFAPINTPTTAPTRTMQTPLIIHVQNHVLRGAPSSLLALAAAAAAAVVAGVGHASTLGPVLLLGISTIEHKMCDASVIPTTRRGVRIRLGVLLRKIADASRP